jgi:protein-disulfide isomerase
VKRFNTESREKRAQRPLVRNVSLMIFAAMMAASLAPLPTVRAQSPKTTPVAPKAAVAPPAVQKTVEAYLRNVYAFGPDVQLTISQPKDSEVPGLLETTVDLKGPDGSQSAKMYLSKDGKYLVRGEISDLSKDPLAETRAQIQMEGAPSLGDPQAPVTLVEFSDFECPVCRQLHDTVRGLLPNYPQVRVVFKDYPIEQLHPWARTAALAGRCSYQQDPKAFWKIYDSIYDHQDIISASNAWNKMTDYAADAGLNADAFRSCLASPEAGAAVDKSRANGQRLDVNSTPTVFVNGRRMVGADPHLLEQFIQYELARLKSPRAKTAEKQ